MNGVGWCWLAAGVLAGWVQTWSLYRDARALAGGLSFGPLRLLLVGALLVTAALQGGILPVAAGWLGGFLLGVAWFLARRTA